MKAGIFAISFALFTGTFAAAGPPDPCSGYPYYDIGSPVLKELYLSPSGSDENDGLSPSSPLRTMTAAWGKIPAGTLTQTGYRLNLLPGTYPCEPGPESENCQNYFTSRRGTYQYPVILRGANGPGTAVIRGGLDIGNCSYLYLVDLDLIGGTPLPTNASGNNLLHFAGCDHILLRGLRVEGPNCDNDACNNLQEVLKVNQSQYFYVENCSISGAWHTVVDYMVVQYGHFLDNRLKTGGQWGMYTKGGTSYLLVAGNEFSNTLLGFGAGQSANLAMMVPPWLHYEVYDIKFVNNILHDLPGSGMAVSGGYNILLAYNTLYRVGYSPENGYTLAQFVPGERNCTPTDELPNPVPTCGSYLDEGGWGPNFQTESLPGISNRNIYVYNNIFYNPAPLQTMYTHLGVNGPLQLPGGFINAPNPALSDDDLSFRGNVIWNGPSAGLPIFGSSDGGDSGCQGSNPTCNEAQFIADNAVNTLEPQMVDPAAGDFHPKAGGNLFTAPVYQIPDFTWADAPTRPAVPQGDTSNAVPYDRAGSTRTSPGPPGAYATEADECILTCSATVPSTGIVGTDIVFSAQFMNPACWGEADFAWNFGDGMTAISANVTHSFSAIGTYNWTLTVTADGQTCTKNGSITITTAPHCMVICDALAPADSVAGEPVSFVASATLTSCIEQAVFSWDFGDGATSRYQNTTHAYDTSGTFTWNMRVEADGAWCSKSGSIKVVEVPTCTLVCTAEAPKNATIGSPVAFSSTATPSNCTGATVYSWDFGDGGTSSLQNPEHVYETAGNYSWTLDVKVNGATCTKTGATTVTASGRIPGDCDGDNSVSIGEVQKAINMFLGLQTPGCGVDCDGSGQVSIGELQKVINAFLGLAANC